MPADRKIMQRFIAQYGKKRGEGAYYGHAVNSKPFAKAVGEMSVYKRAHKK